MMKGVNEGPTCPFEHWTRDCPIESADDLQEVINYLHTICCPLGSVCDIDVHARECRESAAEILHSTNGDVYKARDAIWAFTRAYAACGGEGVVLWPMLATLGQF